MIGVARTKLPRCRGNRKAAPPGQPRPLMILTPAEADRMEIHKRALNAIANSQKEDFGDDHVWGHWCQQVAETAYMMGLYATCRGIAFSEANEAAQVRLQALLLAPKSRGGHPDADLMSLESGDK